jgi:hypothetical protein
VTHFEIIEAQPQHCGRMARMLRQEHAAVLIGLGVRPHHELRSSFEHSSFRRAWFIDGQLAAVGGVMGTAAESSGVVWLAVARWATRYRIAMLREARKQLAEIAVVKRTLQTLVFPADAASFRFAQRLGFRVREDIETIFEAVMMEWRSSEPLQEAA